MFGKYYFVSDNFFEQKKYMMGIENKMPKKYIGYLFKRDDISSPVLILIDFKRHIVMF